MEPEKQNKDIQGGVSQVQVRLIIIIYLWRIPFSMILFCNQC